MTLFNTDTIIALASGHGAAGVAVLRLSGPQALNVATTLSGRIDVNPRQAYYNTLRDPATDKQLDQTLWLYFQGPHSFTGEDIVEFHVHGGKAVIQSVMNVCLGFDNVRMADHGEFSKRAYLNGKIDLTKAEGIADLVAAETQAQADLALQQMGGGLRDLYHGWMERLKKALAYIEADIDFSDEELDEDLVETMRPDLETVLNDINDHLNDANHGERLRDGIHVAIIGPPNAGKSTLINALAQRDVAIVSETAGTTRDAIEVHLNIAGYPVILIDTAGIRSDSNDDIEVKGIERALKRADNADLRLLLRPADDAPSHESFEAFEADSNTIIINSKSDQTDNKHDGLNLSITDDGSTGIDELLDVLQKQIKGIYQQPRDRVFLTRQRHRDNIENARDYLKQSLNGSEVALIAEDLRMSLRALGRVTGRVDVEDLLDVIFKDFCIGK